MLPFVLITILLKRRNHQGRNLYFIRKENNEFSGIHMIQNNSHDAYKNESPDKSTDYGNFFNTTINK